MAQGDSWVMAAAQQMGEGLLLVQVAVVVVVEGSVLSQMDQHIWGTMEPLALLAVVVGAQGSTPNFQEGLTRNFRHPLTHQVAAAAAAAVVVVVVVPSLVAF